MPLCPVCKTENSEERKFCSICGCDLNAELSFDEKKHSLEIITDIKLILTCAETMGRKLKQLEAQQTTQSIPRTESYSKGLEEIEKRLSSLELFEGDYQENFLQSRKIIEEQKKRIDSLEKIISEFPNIERIFNTFKDEINAQVNTELTRKIDKLKKEVEEKLQEQANSLTDHLCKQNQSELSEFTTSFNQQFQEQLTQIKSDSNEQIITLQKRTKKNEDYLKEVEKYFALNNRAKSQEDNSSLAAKGNQFSSEDVEVNRGESPIANKFNINITWDESQLAQQYNDDFSTLSSRIIEVSETQKSFSNRSLGSSQTVILEVRSKGIYGVLSEDNINYLVPSQNFKITKNNHKTVEDLFECRGYQPESSGNFQLVKPAIVSSPSSDQQWELQKRGILEF